MQPTLRQNNVPPCDLKTIQSMLPVWIRLTIERGSFAVCVHVLLHLCLVFIALIIVNQLYSLSGLSQQIWSFLAVLVSKDSYPVDKQCWKGERGRGKGVEGWVGATDLWNHGGQKAV